MYPIVDSHVLPGHGLRGVTELCLRPDAPCPVVHLAGRQGVDVPDALRDGSRVVERDQEPVLLVPDHLAHRSEIMSDDRRSARQCFEHREVERLFQLDGHQEVTQPGQPRQFLLPVDLAQVPTEPLVEELALDLAEVRAMLGGIADSRAFEAGLTGQLRRLVGVEEALALRVGPQAATADALSGPPVVEVHLRQPVSDDLDEVEEPRCHPAIVLADRDRRELPDDARVLALVPAAGTRKEAGIHGVLGQHRGAPDIAFEELLEEAGLRVGPVDVEHDLVPLVLPDHVLYLADHLALDLLDGAEVSPVDPPVEERGTHVDEMRALGKLAAARTDDVDGVGLLDQPLGQRGHSLLSAAEGQGVPGVEGQDDNLTHSGSNPSVRNSWGDLSEGLVERDGA